MKSPNLSLPIILLAILIMPVVSGCSYNKTSGQNDIIHSTFQQSRPSYESPSPPPTTKNKTKSKNINSSSQLALIKAELEKHVSIPIYLPTDLPSIKDSYYYFTAKYIEDGYTVDFYIVNNTISKQRFKAMLGPNDNGVPISGQIAAGSLYNKQSVPCPSPPYFKNISNWNCSSDVAISGIPLKLYKNLGIAKTVYAINGYRVILQAPLSNINKEDGYQYLIKIFNTLLPYLKGKELPSNSIVSIDHTGNQPFNSLWWTNGRVQYNLNTGYSLSATLRLVSLLRVVTK